MTGLGVCCPLGVGVRTSWQRLLDGQSGLVNLPDDPFFDGIPARVVGSVPRGTGPNEFNESAVVTPGDRRPMSLGTVFSLCAAKEALEDAQWFPTSDADRVNTGVNVGSCVANQEEISSAGDLIRKKQPRKVSPLFIPRILTNMPSGQISITYGFQGPNHSVSTACSTGVHSVGDASNFIARGMCDVMVTGGAEACLHPIILAGLCRAKALSTKFNSTPQAASRPFDKQRDGFVMGEGAGILVLEELEHAKKRGANIYAEILGYGLSGDAHHITSPPDDGRGARRSMQMALATSNLSPSDIGHINAHATSTPVGDAVENRAMKSVFGDHSYNLLVTAPKSSIGHLLGAAGAVEAIFTILAVKNGIVPPTLNLEEKEPEFDLNYCSDGAVQWNKTGGKRRVAMTNSFGFGGTNASLVIGENID